MVLHQCPEMLGGLAGHGVETLVRRGDGTVTEPAKQLLDLGRPLPNEDRLGPVRRAESIDKAEQCGIAWHAAEQPVEVVAECAADAEPSAMSRCFDVAALAVEVDGDLSACRADRLAIGGAQARQEPILETLWAGSAGVHGVVVADVA